MGGVIYGKDTTSWSSLGFIGVNATTGDTTKPEYTTTSLPFGNMTNLNAIKFGNFTSATTNDTTTSTESVMAKTTADTWSQVAKIMSSFAKETKDATPSTTTNLSAWDDTNDVSVEVKSSENRASVVTSVTLKTGSGGSTTITIDDNSSSQTIKVGEITWTIKVDKTAGTITITSSNDVDTYRVVSADSASSTTYSNSHKAFFNTKEETYTDSTTNPSTTSQVVVPNSSITVTLNVVAAATK